MAQATIDPPTIESLADLLRRLGDIPLERFRFRPAPGTATEEDLIELDRRGDSLCELVDGTVVFEPLTVEDVLNICERIDPMGVIVQFGGQTPLNLARALEAAGVPIIGTSPESIDLAEDRERFLG